MTESTANRSELFLRSSRRSMFFVLLIVLSLGIIGLVSAISPDGRASRFFERSAWMIPMAIVLMAAALQTSMRKHKITLDSPEARLVMNDELRQMSMDRARRIAFLAVLIAQVPIALMLSHSALGLGFGADLPAFRAVMAMAIATITLGVTVFIGCFLVFDRE